VAEQVRYGLDVDTLLEPTDRRGVPQCVDADALDSSGLRRDVDDAEQVARVDGSAELVGEDQSRVLPLISCVVGPPPGEPG